MNVRRSSWRLGCALMMLAFSRVAFAICDVPPGVSVGRSGASQLVVSFTNMARPVPSTGGFQRCFTHYNLRWAVPQHGEQQVEVSDGVCSPYPSSACVYSMNANVDKPYRVSMQGCNSRFLASSRCTAWSSPAYFLPYGQDTCADGYVWREAFPNDHVCVPPDTRRQAAADNAAAASRLAGGGDYGPGTCKVGFVWREADRFGGNTAGNDRVCVPPATRQQAWNDNATAPSRKARP